MAGYVDVTDVVDKMRDDRGGLVQHLQQLQFLHDAITQYALLLAPFRAMGKKSTLCT